MRDRLVELQGGTRTSESKERLSNDSHALIEETPHPFFHEFFDTVEIIKNGCRNIELAASSLDSLNDAAIAGSESTESESFDTLERVVNETNDKIKMTQALLQKLTHDTIDYSSHPSANHGEKRIRFNLTDNLNRKFVTVVEQYQSAQLRYRKDLRKMFIARLRTVKSDFTNVDIERLLHSHSPDQHRNIIRDMVMKGTVSESISNSLLHTTDLYTDIQNLEQSIRQLHDIFLSMAVIVDNQSELLTQIQYHVEQSEEYLDQGNEDLAAVISQRQKRRGICFCCWSFFS